MTAHHYLPVVPHSVATVSHCSRTSRLEWRYIGMITEVKQCSIKQRGGNISRIRKIRQWCFFSGAA
jgi:hypothetical protein